MRNVVRMAVLLGGCIMLGACRGALDPQGPQSERIADLTWVLVGLGTLLFLLVMALLGYALIRQRTGEQPDTHSETRMVIAGGVVLPVIVLFTLMGFTVDSLRDLDALSSEDELQIDVLAREFWWDVTYPEENVRTANEIHIPVGRTVVLNGTSSDVVHSFWVPQLGGKFDFVPGKPVELKIRADEPGTYRGQCAEFCGLGHAQMATYIIAQPPDEFEAWLESQRMPMAEPEGESAQNGRDIFFSSSCIACHGVAGTESEARAGPDLTHFASRNRFAGAYWPINEENLETWISDPDQLKPGVGMPATDMSDEDLDDLVAFLLSLE